MGTRPPWDRWRSTGRTPGCHNHTPRLRELPPFFREEFASPSAAASFSLLSWLRRALGASPSTADHEEEAEEEEEHDAADYVHWGDEASFTLDKLDAQVVFAGRVDAALSSVGQQRGWAEATNEQGTQELRLWMRELQVEV